MQPSSSMIQHFSGGVRLKWHAISSGAAIGAGHADSWLLGYIMIPALNPNQWNNQMTD